TDRWLCCGHDARSCRGGSRAWRCVNRSTFPIPGEPRAGGNAVQPRGTPRTGVLAVARLVDNEHEGAVHVRDAAARALDKQLPARASRALPRIEDGKEARNCECTAKKPTNA